jgi:hypothetical protein
MQRVDSQSEKQEKTKGSWIGLRWEGDDIESVELVGVIKEQTLRASTHPRGTSRKFPRETKEE